MINLLPPETKEEFHYGLRNTLLLRWVSAFVFALVGLGVIATYGMLTMQHSTQSFAQQNNTAQAALDKDDLKGTEAQVKDMTSNLKLVVQVLSKEVLFSKLLKQVATVIPPNTILKNLDISQTTGAIDITAAAADYQSATQVQVNLQDPANKIFSKADIVSISCSSSPDDPQHPCAVQIRALFSNNNPYLFINSKEASQ